MSACKHIAGNMHSLLMDDEVRYISGPLLQQLDRDLQECESKSYVFVLYSDSIRSTQ